MTQTQNQTQQQTQIGLQPKNGLKTNGLHKCSQIWTPIWHQIWTKKEVNLESKWIPEWIKMDPKWIHKTYLQHWLHFHKPIVHHHIQNKYYQGFGNHQLILRQLIEHFPQLK